MRIQLKKLGYFIFCLILSYITWKYHQCNWSGIFPFMNRFFVEGLERGKPPFTIPSKRSLLVNQSWYLVQFLSTRLKGGSFFSKPRVFLHFSSSNVVQWVWRAQGSIWRCSNRESFLIDKLFSIGPWYDFIEECERRKIQQHTILKEIVVIFHFMLSVVEYIGDKTSEACKMGLYQMHTWIWFFNWIYFGQMAKYTRGQEFDIF